jgi:hypothetical protein
MEGQMKYGVRKGEEFAVVVVVAERRSSGNLGKVAIIMTLSGLLLFGGVGVVTGDYHVFDTLGQVVSGLVSHSGKADGSKT